MSVLTWGGGVYGVYEGVITPLRSRPAAPVVLRSFDGTLGFVDFLLACLGPEQPLPSAWCPCKGMACPGPFRRESMAPGCDVPRNSGTAWQALGRLAATCGAGFGRLRCLRPVLCDWGRRAAR